MMFLLDGSRVVMASAIALHCGDSDGQPLLHRARHLVLGAFSR